VCVCVCVCVCVYIYIYVYIYVPLNAETQVYKADWRGMTVVVKSLKRDSNATDDMLFENEISLMSTLRQ